MCDLRGSQLLDAKAGKPLAQINALVKSHALDNSSGETTSEGITVSNVVSEVHNAYEVTRVQHVPSSVGVVYLLLGDLVDFILIHLYLTILLGYSSDGGQSSLSDGSDAWTAPILLWQRRKLLGNLNDVCGSPAVVLGVGQSLGFVADEVVGVWDHAVELIFEKLRNEWGGER